MRSAAEVVANAPIKPAGVVGAAPRHAGAVDGIGMGAGGFAAETFGVRFAKEFPTEKMGVVAVALATV